MMEMLKMVGEEMEKSVNTKHAGQQDLQIRDDDKIFATGTIESPPHVHIF